MGNLFSGLFGGGNSKKKSTINGKDKALLDLKAQRDKLVVYKKKINKVMERETELARQLLKEKKKERALLAIKKKKYQQRLLDKTEKQLDNIETLTSELEFAQIEAKVFEGLKEGTKALQEIQKEMRLEDVEKIMEDSREAIAYQEEIGRALGESLTQEDEVDVDDELKQLEDDMLSSQLDQVKPSTKELPSQNKEPNQEEEEQIEEEIEEEPTKKKVAVPM